MRLLGFGKPKEKQKLTTDKAVELGAELIGEAFLYTVFGTIMFIEYYLSSKSSEREKEKQRQYLEREAERENRIVDLELQNARHEAQLRELDRIVRDLESKNYNLMQKVSNKG